MRVFLLASILCSCLVVLAASRSAEACSPVNDTAEPPTTELPYDAANSPEAPRVLEARLLHHHYDSSGCENSSCGDLHSLNLTLEVDPSTTLVRIDFSDRPHIYANVWGGETGRADIRIPGYADDEFLDLTLSALDDNGYVSTQVSLQIYSDAHNDDSCSATGTQSSALLVLMAVLLGLVRRQRRA